MRLKFRECAINCNCRRRILPKIKTSYTRLRNDGNSLTVSHRRSLHIYDQVSNCKSVRRRLLARALFKIPRESPTSRKLLTSTAAIVFDFPLRFPRHRTYDFTFPPVLRHVTAENRKRCVVPVLKRFYRVNFLCRVQSGATISCCNEILAPRFARSFWERAIFVTRLAGPNTWVELFEYLVVSLYVESTNIDLERDWVFWFASR